MRALVCALLALLALAGTTARAEIFACPAPRGMTMYQNFPCEFNSLGSMPSAPSTTAGSALPVTPNAPGARTAFRATPAAARPPPVAAVAARGGVRPGMSEDDVQKAWGEPAEIIQDEPPSGRIDIWRYKDGRSVQINRRRQVVTVQQ